ncbi:hypothetical protein AVEN_275431-1 [Araneus ventricosus]|uniref:Uncharacterized protein n=1 Tax=Araneus ventricosus TaxID=182803 RepID=A0A4Y2LC66_ARAVE|nr:hypothetical protein AVEN_275431-1 [Araneus ventricosus]
MTHRTKTIARFTKERWPNTRAQSVMPKLHQQPFLKLFFSHFYYYNHEPIRKLSNFPPLHHFTFKASPSHPANKSAQMRASDEPTKASGATAQNRHNPGSRALYEKGRGQGQTTKVEELDLLRMEKPPSFSPAPLKPPLSLHSTTSLQ